MGKVALVTGSSRGIGRAIAIRLAKDGYDVCINFTNNEDRAKEVLKTVNDLYPKVKAMIYRADVSDENQVGDMFQAVENTLGPVELLVCNAGIAGQMQIQDITKERWDRFFAVNVDGTFNTVKAALTHMLHAHKGCIITISSMWGLRGASCESAYSATKAAIIGFSRSLSNELAPSGIRVNCVAPGVIDTEMMDEFPKEVKDALAEETPVGRLGKPEDVAAAVSFFASEDASFITGQVLSADGGYIV